MLQTKLNGIVKIKSLTTLIKYYDYQPDTKPR